MIVQRNAKAQSDRDASPILVASARKDDIVARA
jgi:hypothetical protein